MKCKGSNCTRSAFYTGFYTGFDHVLRNDTKRIVEIVTKFFDKYKVQCMSICRSGVIHEINLIPFL